MAGIEFKRFKYFLNVGDIQGDIELDNAPEGWEKTNITYGRSTTYFGLMRTLTLPLKFVGKGAKLLRQQYYSLLLAARVNFKIQQINQSFGYDEIYSGLIDFSKAQNSITAFSVPSLNNDFSKNLLAYDSVQYAIPLIQANTVNVELPPILLNEIANIIPGTPSDGVIHSDYFVPMQVLNNVQNSINPSVQSVQYGQLRLPNFAVMPNWFFNSQITGKLFVTGSITFKINIGALSAHLKLFICNQTGAIIIPVYDDTPFGGVYNGSFTFNHVLNVNQGDKLFFYMQQVGTETANTGITITGGQIDMSYQTSTPASMCYALRGNDLFASILKAMNFNTDYAPNLPVPNQSNLLANLFKPIVFTSSDSIRSGQGSLYQAGVPLSPGIYTVLSGTAAYAGTDFTVGQKFGFVDGFPVFASADNAVIQKTQTVQVGAVYNIGDTLTAGGTYLVEGNAGQHAVYNGINVPVGQYFKYFLGQTTFAGSDDSIFAKQIGEDPQIIISLKDFFQSILSFNGGQVALGIEQQANTDPATKAANPTIGVVYLEDMSYVYRRGINAVSLGNVDAGALDEPAIELQGNTLKVGYNDQQYDAVNGSREVNSTQFYSTFLTAPAKEINLVSIIRADPYGIEAVRITQADTAASRSNNDTFAIWLKDNPEDSPVYQYYRPLRTEGLMVNPVTGLPMISGADPSYYNWKLTPKQNLLRGSNYLASIFYGLNGYQIKLTGALKNSGLVTVDINGRRVAEADPINISGMGEPLFIPIYYSVSPGLPNNVLYMLDQSPYADLNFNINGKNLKAFINNLATQIGDNKPQTVKLLLTPDNNLLDLIH